MTEDTNRATGKIIKVHEAGWGFISSHDIEFTRIFFHWQALVQDTLNFKDLRIGMKVEFTPVKHIDPETKKEGYRAHKIRVIENEVKT